MQTQAYFSLPSLFLYDFESLQQITITSGPPACVLFARISLVSCYIYVNFHILCVFL